MNILKATSKTNAVFLIVVLIAGTFAAISPSFMVGAQAVPQYGMEREYGSYEQPEYGMDSYEKPSFRNDNYEQREYPLYQKDYKPEYPSYGKDNTYKSKDSSSVSINKLKCINNNVNINGNNTGDINVGNSGSSATGSGTDEGYLGVGSSDGYGEEEYDNGYNKQKDKGFSCIINNNNNNTNVVAGGGDVTDGGGNVAEPTGTLAVTKAVICNPTDNSQPATAACLTIENTILPSSFDITVTGNNPNPSEFAGSNTPPGVVVTLGEGDYEVTEEVPNVPIPAGVSVTRTTTFDGDCTDVEPGQVLSTVAAGTIEAGQSQTCAITNSYDATTLPGGGLTTSNINTGDIAPSNINTGDIAPSFSSPPTIAQGTEEDLTSLEKVEKLKQQWLDLLQ